MYNTERQRNKNELKEKERQKNQKRELNEIRGHLLQI